MMGTDPKKPEEMQPKEVLSYSVAGLGQNIICQLVTTFFMIYMTDVAGVSARWLAWMFLGARLFDAFNDPIMGTFVDMTKSKWGKMRPYLKFSPIPIAILTALLFTSFPSWSMGAKFAYSTVIYIAWGIAYTSVDVPYWGLASSMTSDFPRIFFTSCIVLWRLTFIFILLKSCISCWQHVIIIINDA